jgi:hypothetical protein
VEFPREVTDRPVGGLTGRRLLSLQFKLKESLIETEQSQEFQKLFTLVHSVLWVQSTDYERKCTLI